MRRKWTQDYEERFSPDGRSYYAYTGRRFQLTEEGRRTCAARELPLLALSIAVEGDDMALGAAAIGAAHMHRDLDDLAARFRDLRLV